MITPNNQKVYFTNDGDLDELFPEAEDTFGAALDVLEGEQSFIAVDGETLPVAYIVDKDAFIVENSDVSSYAEKKARQLMAMLVKGELFRYSDIDKENGFMPDADYPMSVNFANGMTYSMESYYPSLEQMANAKVLLWSGSGYKLDELFVNVPGGASSPEAALEAAVVLAEKIAPQLLLEVDTVQDEMAAEGHYNPETGDEDAIFQETYLYVDATTAGADRAYYVYAENFGVLPNNGELI